MTEEGAARPERPPATSLADLVVPRRPAGVPYADGEDYDAQALLTVNGYAAETEILIGLLDSDLGILQAAAARTLGARGERATIGALERIAKDVRVEETVRMQAAFALARMDVAGATDMLVRLLDLSPEASPAPLQAAGALARLGDPRGFEVVRTALDSANPVTAMVACKQIFAFAALDGRPLPAGGRVDAFGAISCALARSEPNIVAEGRAQVEALGMEQARKIVTAHRTQQP
jgi:hypothetical protein